MFPVVWYCVGVCGVGLGGGGSWGCMVSWCVVRGCGSLSLSRFALCYVGSGWARRAGLYGYVVLAYVLLSFLGLGWCCVLGYWVIVLCCAVMVSGVVVLCGVVVGGWCVVFLVGRWAGVVLCWVGFCCVGVWCGVLRGGGGVFGGVGVVLCRVVRRVVLWWVGFESFLCCTVLCWVRLCVVGLGCLVWVELLGPANPCPTAVDMEPYSTSAFIIPG